MGSIFLVTEQKIIVIIIRHRARSTQVDVVIAELIGYKNRRSRFSKD